MAWNTLVARAAQEHLARFPAKDRKKTCAALLSLSDGPFSGDIVKLEDAGSRWRRVGSYRIFFAVDMAGRTVTVSAITRRTSTTY